MKHKKRIRSKVDVALAVVSAATRLKETKVEPVSLDEVLDRYKGKVEY